MSCKAVTKNLYRNSEKSFLECKKNGFKKHLPAIFLRKFFHVCNINKFFSFNLKLICTCEFFKKLKLHSSKRLVQFQLFEKLTRTN